MVWCMLQGHRVCKGDGDVFYFWALFPSAHWECKARFAQNAGGNRKKWKNRAGRKASYGVLGYVGKAALRGGEMKAFGGCDLKFVVTPGTDSGNALRFKKKKKICFVCFFFNGLLRDVILIFTFCFGVFLGGCFLCCICASHGACWPSNEFSGWSEILKSKIKRKVGTAQLWGCGFCLETHSSRDVCPKKNPSEAEMQTWLRRSFSHTSMPFGKSELVRKEKRALNSEFSLAWVLGTENLRVIIRGEKKPLSALFHPQYSLSIPFWLPSPMFGPQTPDLST